MYGRGSVIPSASLHFPAREEMKTTTTAAAASSWRHNHQHHSPLHAGDALLSSDPTQPSATHSALPHVPTREEEKAMTTATSWQHNHECHDPGDEPGTPLLYRDPTPAAVKPRSRHLSFLHACLHGTPGGALS